MKHYEVVTRQAEELLKELENNRPYLALQQVVIRAETAMAVLWPSLREAIFEMTEMQGVYQCLDAIRMEALQGLPAPNEMLGKIKKHKEPESFIDQLRKLPQDKIRELIYNLEGEDSVKANT